MKTTFKDYKDYCSYVLSLNQDKVFELAKYIFEVYNPQGGTLEVCVDLELFKKEYLDPINDPIELIQAIRKLGVDFALEQKILFRSSYDQVIVLHSKEYDQVFYNLDNLKDELMNREIYNHVFNEDF